MLKFHWSDSDYGFFTALYYLGYAGMQIPISVALDNWGLKKTMASAIFMTGLGSLTFSLSHNSSLALFARFLLGSGSAVSFLAMAKVVNQYFIKKDLVMSVSFSIALLGLLANVPMSLLLENNYTWMSLSKNLAIMTFGMSLIALIFLPTKKALSSFKLSDFIKLLQKKEVLVLALINFLLVGALEGFADIWGLNYLLEIIGLEKSLSAQIMSFIFLGMLFGGPFLTYLSQKFGYYNILDLSGFILDLAVGLFPLITLTISQMILLSFIIGVFSCYQVLIMILGSSIAGNSTVPIGFLNSINMLGGAFFHWIVGFSLFYLHQNYSYQISYSLALLTIPFGAILGSFLVFFMKK
jgi:MFS family permease